MKLRILSLGAGVQSSTLALMIQRGEIPMVDAAIFADTIGEPKIVMKWLNWLEKQLSFPVYRVSKGNLRQDTIDRSNGGGKYKYFLDIPFFTRHEVTGKKGLGKRQCTTHYKIIPVAQKIRQLLGLKKRQRVKKDMSVELLMGISYDELFRMKPNRIPYIQNVFPLIDMKMNREDCKNWMKDNGYPNPPRSACTFCPFHSNEEWRDIKNNEEEWQQVVAFDKTIRKGTNDEYLNFLHNSAEPIDQVNFNKKDNQPSLFIDGCVEGYCGN